MVVICKAVFSGLTWQIWIAPFAVVYLGSSYDVLLKAGRNILRGKVFDENFLMAIASLGAFALGEFIEACAVMLFYQIGECFQSYAVDKSRKSISKLMDIRPDFVRALRDGEEEIIDPDEMSVGELFVVRAGDKIPLDGVIIEGNCHLNTAALTGESKPLAVTVGDQILSGTVCLDGKLVVQSQKEFYDSTVSKILDMVENASTKKAKVESFISVFSKYYTPIVVISAALLFLIPSLIWGGWAIWAERALTFLVVSCPCALVISVPLGFFGGIGGAGSQGVLIKGANYIEQLSKANIFVFDKTGTLTKGEFSVVSVEPSSRREDILKYASICEKHSNHPIAKSILKEYGGEVENGYQIQEIAGKGVVARKGDEVVLCGNQALLNDFKVAGFCLENACDNCKTAVYIAIKGVFYGEITLDDTVREDAYKTVDELTKSGAKVYMLTGDNEQSAKKVAKQLNIKNYSFGLLPQDKMSRVEELLNSKEKGDTLCFIGDGINDAPVIMRADIGVSMGGIGSDSAIEASDAVLMHDKVYGVVTARKTAKKTMRIITQNIVFALAIKFSALLLSVFGIGGMWYAVFADVGVSVLAILNSMRTLKKPKQDL